MDQNPPFLGQLCGDRSLGVLVGEAQAVFPFLGTWKLYTPLGQGWEATWLCSLEPKNGLPQLYPPKVHFRSKGL